MGLSNPGFIGKALIASAVFWILQLIFVTLLYAVGSPFGVLSDFSNAMTFLLMLPLAFALYSLNKDKFPALSLIALIIGFAGVFSVAIPSILIIIGIMNFQQTLPPIMAGFGAVGVWLAISFWIARASGGLPPKLTVWGIVIGLGLASFAGLLTLDMGNVFTGGGMQEFFSNPFVYPALIIGPIGYFAYPVWAIWLGRLLRSGKLAAFS